jgi:hypothetical protein
MKEQSLQGRGMLQAWLQKNLAILGIVLLAMIKQLGIVLLAMVKEVVFPFVVASVVFSLLLTVVTLALQMIHR